MSLDKKILHSTPLSISINDALRRFFKCSRGVRQADPLSPLLFCLAENVLSVNILRLVSLGNLGLIIGLGNVKVHSHSLYAYAIFIFCKGSTSNIKAFTYIFNSYSLAFGQVINRDNSSVHFKSMSSSIINISSTLTGLNTGYLPFTYPGVPIFKVRPKSSYLEPIVHKILSKLASLKGSLLLIVGRIKMVKYAM